jgi:hypothetical protein
LQRRCDDVEDEDEDIGDAETVDDCELWTGPFDGGRQDNPSGALFNLEEKSSCRFSADAGGGFARCNSWLMDQERRADRQRHDGNRLVTVA